MLRFYKPYMGLAREAFTYSTYWFRPHHTPEKKFVIFTVGRSGSTLLVSLLNSHPLIRCKGELLERRVLDPGRYLRCHEFLSEREVYGFKLNTYHFDVQKLEDPIMFIQGLHRSGYQIISLKRKNILRQVISHLYALERNKFHHRRNQGAQVFSPFYVDVERLPQEFKFFLEHDAKYEKALAHLPSLKLVYETDLADENQHQSTVDKIADFLSIPTARVSSDYVRTTPENLAGFIENYDELCRYIQKTEYAEYLETN